MKPLKAIIMAGGEGSRLRPLTCDCPKPMLPLMGKPLMEYAIRLLKQHGITEIAVTLGYLPDAVMDYFGDGSTFGVKLHYYIEKIPLGTAGSVKQARDFLNEPFIVLSGDGVTDFNLHAAVDFHRKNDAYATLLLKKCPNPQEYGMVVTDAQQRIQSFHEKPGRCDVFSDRINTGVYILEPEILDRIPDHAPYDFGHDLFPALLQANAALYGYTAGGYWCDVGDISAYLQVHRDAMDGKIHLDGLPSSPGISADQAVLERGCRIDAPCMIGKGSRIASGAHIGPYTVIGENCRVETAAEIQHSVVFNHVQIESGAHLLGCTAAAHAVVAENAMLHEGSVVGSRSRIGARATLPPGVKLWPDKALPDGERPDANIVWGSQREQRFIGGKFALESPVQATRATQSIAAHLNPREILIGHSASTVASALWLAAAAGAMSQGVRVINAGVCSLPQLRHTLHTLQPDAAVMIDDQFMIPMDSLGAMLNEKSQRAILKLYERQDFACPFSSVTVPMEDAGRTDAAYIAHLASAFRSDPKLTPAVVLYCQTEHLRKIAGQAFSRAGLQCRCEWDARNVQPHRDEIAIYLSDDGQIACFADRSGRMDEAHRQMLIAWTALESGEPSLILHNSATRAIETLATTYTAHARYLPGEYALWVHTLAEKSPLQFMLQLDGLYASLSILSMLTEKGLSLSQWQNNMPHVYRKNTSVQLPASECGRLLHIIADEARDAELGGGVRLWNDHAWAWLSPDDARPDLNIMVESMQMEAADELCAHLQQRLTALCMQ